MRFITFAVVACLVVFAVADPQCNDHCNDSSDCVNAGSCRLCIDNTCQHRCASFTGVEDKDSFLTASCGDSCSESSDCASAGDCRLCISGTCQHRCAAEEQ